MQINRVIAWFCGGLLAGALAALLTTSGCSKKVQPPDAASQLGVASWYGHPFDGRLTANGETYDMEKLTAAHRTFPFGTVVRVENLSNNRTVDVRINDRGPFVQGRIIDLSHAAAQNISMQGIANVRLSVLSMPPTRDAEMYAVQVQPFAQRSDAERMRQQMEDKFGSARLVFRQGDETWRVLVGMEPTVEGANALAQQIEKETGPVFVVLAD
jgi:rare lipoprotein A